MKIKIAAFLAGIIGVLGVLLFLVAFGTDYWLLATETCGGFTPENGTYHTEEVGMGNWTKGILTFHHEGFFWRCWFFGEDYKETIWNFWFTSQAHPKHCMHGYLFPMPIALGPHPHPSYDATAVYRGFWTALIVLAVTASLVGGFLLVCGVPFVSARFYKVGGGFFITAAVKEDAVNISLLKKTVKFLIQGFHNLLLGPRLYCDQRQVSGLLQ
ncbi:transmembrane protein 182-like isoform X2 [Lacerta agilis]|uniref:transmembrane protein 182-like isoform X2 n=1 Tax=Lacerta agilis TaxID=80427 RepID=UPI0014196970|nr:transmembrane protein 182-like isoform X2 [Lacerta agilis]